MKRTLVALAITVVASLSAAAQDIQFAAFQDVKTAYEAQQAEIEQLRAQLASFQEVMADPAQAPAAENCCCESWCSPCPGVDFSAEFVWLRGGDSDADSPSDSFEFGQRYQLGYMNECGREIRVRYFDYDNPDVTGDGKFEMRVIDLEGAGRFELGCNWYGEFSGGIRWVDLSEEFALNYNNAWGPVVSMQVRTPVLCNVEAYGLFRGSYLVGEEAGDDLGGFGITEVQIGLEYQQCTCYGKTFVRGLFEAQHIDGPIEDENEDVTLVGFGIAAGIAR